MSSKTPKAERSWSVGDYTVTLSIAKPQRGQVVCRSIRWEPNEPARLTSAEWFEYRIGRNRALVEIARQLGITVALLEV